MSRSKKLYMLLGILLVSCLVTFGVSKYEERKEEIKNSDEVILEVKSEDVTAVSWEYGSEKLSFHKDKTWLYDEDEAFPVDGEKIQEVLEQFEKFGVSFVIENVEDYGQYGLDTPLCTIQMKTEKEDYEILLGDYSDMDSERYVSIGDGNAYLVKDDPLDFFKQELKDMIRHDEVPELENVTGIQFSGTESYGIIYEEDSAHTYCKEDVYFVKKDGEYLPLDTSNVDEYLQTLNDLELADYAAYDASEDDLGAYGLAEPELTVTVQYKEQKEDEDEKTDSFVMSIARDPKEKKKAESSSKEDTGDDSENDSEEEITAYARVGDSKIIYQIAGEDYEKLMAASYNDLRHQEVLSAGFADIYQADISLEGKKYTLTTKKRGGERVWYYGDEELEIEDFKNALMGLKASEFSEEQPKGKEEISVAVYLDDENYPEVDIALYRYDGSYCAAVVDGEPVSRVSRSCVVDLVEAVHSIVLD